MASALWHRLLLLGLLCTARADLWCSGFWQGDLAPLIIFNNSQTVFPVSNYTSQTLTLDCLFVIIASSEPPSCPPPQNYSLLLRTNHDELWDMKPYIFTPEPKTFKAAVDSSWRIVVQNTNPSACWETATLSVGFTDFTPCTSNPDHRLPACSGHGTCNLRHYNCSCFASETIGHWEGSLCEDCDGSYRGVNCTQRVSCVAGHGDCRKGSCYGRDGAGTCDACLPEWAGKNCEVPVVCNLTNGGCSAGKCFGTNGTGDCDSCHEGWFNRDCSLRVHCDPSHGSCDSGCYGPSGTGYCSSCKFPYSGNDCSSSFGGFYVAIGLLGVCLATTVALLVHTAFRRRAVEGERANLLTALRVNTVDYHDGASSVVSSSVPAGGRSVDSHAHALLPSRPVDVVSHAQVYPFSTGIGAGTLDVPVLPSLSSFPTSLTPSTRKLLSSSPEKPKRNTITTGFGDHAHHP